MGPSIAFVTSSQHIKLIKTALEKRGYFDKSLKIISRAPRSWKNCKPEDNATSVVPSTLPLQSAQVPAALLAELGLDHLGDSIRLDDSYIHYNSQENHIQTSNSTARGNVLTFALSTWLCSVPLEAYYSAFGTQSVDAEAMRNELIKCSPKKYSTYPPLLLLPTSTFRSIEQGSWSTLLNAISGSLRQDLVNRICESTGTSHIAINEAVPATFDVSGVENVKREPTRLIPFGHLESVPGFGLRRENIPDIGAFSAWDSLFWVSTEQNGITQTWAPLFTMFSRGNIREKRRLLSLPSVLSTSRFGSTPGSVVDMYAGIGYFSFSYAAAGVSQIFCFELNPVSVEGLRRGAQANGWNAAIKSGEAAGDGDVEAFENEIENSEETKTTLFVFCMDNRLANKFISRVRSRILPVRHVNCGLLPSSKKSWPIALEVLDPNLGGWIHLHENIENERLQDKPREILGHVQEELGRICRKKGKGLNKYVAVLEQVDIVKQYGPKISHVVLDIRIDRLR